MDKQRRALFFAAALWAALAFPLTGLENENNPDERGTVYGILRKWYAAENALTAWVQAAGAAQNSGAVLWALDETAAAVEDFRAGYVYRSYLVSSFPLKDRIDELMEILRRIKTALQQGKTEEAERNARTARNILIEWLKYDTEMMNRIQLTYINQNKIFIFAIIGLLIYHTFMFRASRRLQKQERRAVAYSRSIAAAHEEERSRIARELHDSVITELRHLSFLPFTKQAEGNVPALFSSGCDALIRRIREICQDLIPPDFNRLGLVESLKTLCGTFEIRSGIECRLVLQEGLEPVSLSTEKQLYCFRIIQECLANIEKHAGAAETSVVLRKERGGAGPVLLICVTDDGKGLAAFSPSLAGRLGITGMRDRAAMLGGKLFFESERGAGVMVRLEVPINETGR
jgi:signal transduction histidine kinase